MEHLLHNHLTNHLERNKLLTDTQNGFGKKRLKNCETQLLQTIDTLAKAIKNKE